MGPFKGLDRPPDDVEHRMLITVVAKNVIDTTTKNSEPAGLLHDDNIQIKFQNILATKTRGSTSKIPYTVDIAFDEEPHDVDNFYF